MDMYACVTGVRLLIDLAGQENDSMVILSDHPLIVPPFDPEQAISIISVTRFANRTVIRSEVIPEDAFQRIWGRLANEQTATYYDSREISIESLCRGLERPALAAG